MKKLVSLLLVFVLAFSLSVSAFAISDVYNYNGHHLPALPGEHSYYMLLNDADYGELTLYGYNLEESFPGTGNRGTTWGAVYDPYIYRLNGYSWELVEYKSAIKWNLYADKHTWLWSNHNVYEDINQTIILYRGSEPIEVKAECDGTSCPANDLNHDNECDDCGNVLTFNLRTTLLDFAKYQAEEFGPLVGTHKYYAVVEHPTEADSYFIYVSQILMGSTDGETVTGGDMRVCQVVIMEDGRNATRGGWTAVESWSGTVAYANHTIPNFFPVPLAVTIQGVTEEQMKVTLPNLMEVFSILMLCGIGLMSCIVLLKPLRTVLLQFLR